MEHLAETFHIIFGDLDFTTSDRHVGLVLATALQQKRRHVHIKQCLLEGKEAKVSPLCVPKPHKQWYTILPRFTSFFSPSFLYTDGEECTLDVPRVYMLSSSLAYFSSNNMFTLIRGAWCSVEFFLDELSLEGLQRVQCKILF